MYHHKLSQPSVIPRTRAAAQAGIQRPALLMSSKGITLLPAAMGHQAPW
jgi:hypothetical protein